MLVLRGTYLEKPWETVHALRTKTLRKVLFLFPTFNDTFRTRKGTNSKEYQITILVAIPSPLFITVHQSHLPIKWTNPCTKINLSDISSHRRFQSLYEKWICYCTTTPSEQRQSRRAPTRQYKKLNGTAAEKCIALRVYDHQTS